MAPVAVAWAADRLFDGERVLADRAVMVAGDRVAAVIPRALVPPGTSVSYEPGTTLLPGLIDAHLHHLRWAGPLLSAFGVTTVRDTGNDLLWLRAQGGDTAPRLLALGPILDGPPPTHPLVSVACADAAAGVAAVHDLAAAGVDGIKLYCGLPAGWLPEIVAAVHSHGLRASMHCLATGLLGPAEAGIDEFFHLDGIARDVWPDHPPGWLDLWGDPGFDATEDAQQRLADRIAVLGLTATPTLSYWESQWRIRQPGWSSPRADVQSPDLVRWQGMAERTAEGADRWRRALAAAQRFTGLLLDRGVRVLAGSDVPCGAQVPGLSLWRELCLLTEAGMPPLQALRAATADVADFVGRPELGRLAAGGPADFTVVRGDPTAELTRAPEVLTVVQAGIAHCPVELRQRARQLESTVPEDPWGRQLRWHAHGLNAVI